jgi:cation diffusion facilitator family transporter
VSDCGCHLGVSNDPRQQRTLVIALTLNASMAVIGFLAGWIGQSTGVIADALDMLADASAYAIALVAIGRSASFKTRAARVSGALLLVLGVGVLLDVARRALGGSEPASAIMLGAAILSLAVNLTVLRLLRPFRQGEIHLRATWIFTRADVVANLGVIASAAAVWLSGSRIPDLVAGTAIGCYVIREAIEILRSRDSSTASSTVR